MELKGYYLVADILGVVTGAYAVAMVVMGIHYLLGHWKKRVKLILLFGDFAVMLGSIALVVSPWGWKPWMYYFIGIAVNIFVILSRRRMKRISQRCISAVSKCEEVSI